MADQSTVTDPTSLCRTDGCPEQHQDAPGLAEDLTPGADHGEQSYRGTGRLTGRKALVIGADPGIGRAAAIAFAESSYVTGETLDVNGGMPTP